MYFSCDSSSTFFLLYNQLLDVIGIAYKNQLPLKQYKAAFVPQQYR